MEKSPVAMLSSLLFHEEEAGKCVRRCLNWPFDVC
jgi:hypothetical protein